jgi:hypothetical protein
VRLSGTGKSCALQVLGDKGHRVVDTVSGCKTNRGKFYPLLDHIVLLTASAEPRAFVSSRLVSSRRRGSRKPSKIGSYAVRKSRAARLDRRTCTVTWFR